jgi:hypothetical protein
VLVTTQGRLIMQVPPLTSLSLSFSLSIEAQSKPANGVVAEPTQVRLQGGPTALLAGAPYACRATAPLLVGAVLVCAGTPSTSPYPHACAQLASAGHYP